MKILHEDIKFMKIWVNPKNCRGCLRCELACSFHKSEHTAFNPALSSTRVLRSNKDKRIQMTIDDTCDNCSNENAPFCVTACVFGARGFIKREKEK
jgi:Fe-S-cluster-containing hydrogenase component 2